MGRIFSLFLIFLLTAATPETDRWVELTTDHFTLVGDATPAQARQLAQQVEQLQATLEQIAPEMRTESNVPTRIYLFKNEKSFRPYKLDREGNTQSLAGYFAASDDGNYVAIDVSAGEHPEEVIYHEYVHFWLETNVPNIPLWLNEGLAEYYSTFATRGSRVEIGRFVPSHVAWLKSHDLIPLDQLMRADTSSVDYHEGDRVGTFYAQSWALVHYLVADEERRGKLGDYFKAINARRDPFDAFAEVWGTTSEEVAVDLRRYVQRGRFPYFTLKAAKVQPRQATALRKLESSEVWFLLGDLLAHVPPIQFELAEQHLQQAITADEENAAAWATLGYLQQIQGQDRDAAALFKRSLELNQESARTHQLLGASQLESFEATLATGFETFEQPPSMLAQARASFERALTIDPESSGSVVGLARTYVYTPHAEDALLAMGRAIQAAPAQNDLVLDLIVVQAHRGNIDGAIELLQRSLRTRGDASLLRSAEAIIAQVAMEQAYLRFDAGEQEDATKLLLNTAERLDNRTVRKQLQTQAASLQIQALEGVDVEHYNRAIEAANDGNFARAILLLGEVIEMTEQEPLKKVALAQREAFTDLSRQSRHITAFNRAIVLANDHRFSEALKTIDALLADDPDPDLREEIVKMRREIASVGGS